MSDGRLLIFGLGYTGRAIARDAAAAGLRVWITTRAPEDAAPVPGADVIGFDAAGDAVAEATHIVSTAPPPGDGGAEDVVGADPVLRAHGTAIARAQHLRWAGYLSTTGVYGDRQGGWVDETTRPAPGQERSKRRLAAERAWAALADRLAVDLFRVAGIYGPGRSALDDVRSGRARRVLKPGHAFGRIHRDDIAAAVLAALRQHRPPGVRVLNLSDDHPAEQDEVVTEAARLLGQELPPGVPFEQAAAAMSPIGLSFWQENRLVSSAGTKSALGIAWRYPSFREGLRAILAEQIEHGRGE